MNANDRPSYLYHGGVPGLRRGARILPPSITKTGRSLLQYSEEFPESTQRADRVYLTSDVGTAAIYAAGYSKAGGAVYQVIPDQPVESDPDCLEPGLSFQAPAATVVGIVYKRVPLQKERGQ